MIFVVLFYIWWRLINFQLLQLSCSLVFLNSSFLFIALSHPRFFPPLQLSITLLISFYILHFTFYINHPFSPSQSHPLVLLRCILLIEIKSLVIAKNDCYQYCKIILTKKLLLIHSVKALRPICWDKEKIWDIDSNY